MSTQQTKKMELDDVFFKSVMVKDLPGVIEINQSVYFSVPDADREKMKSTVLKYNTSSTDGVFGIVISGNTVALTYTQKVLSSAIHNKPTGICSSLLMNGMLHLKAVLYDFNIPKEAICIG